LSKKHLKLLDYQRTFVDEASSETMFGSNGDFFVNSCVSSGKSFMMSALAQELEGRVVILISISALLDQIAEHLDIFEEKYSILKAGRESEFFPERRIQIVMAQTLHARLDKIDLKADFVIQDEGHREFRSTRTTDIMKHLQPISRFLFSGTCYDSNGFRFQDVSKIFNTVPMVDLIENGRLSDVNYYVPKWANAIDYDNVKLTGSEYNTSALEEIINSPGHILKVVDSMNHMKAKDKKTLVFCSSIEQCNIVAKALKDNGYLAEQVHSKIPSIDQDNILEAFKHNSVYEGHKEERSDSNLFTDDTNTPSRLVKCLVSVNKLGIGFSVEDVELGVLLRPTNIRSLYVQIAGRIYRSHSSKPFGEILDLAQCTKKFGFAQEEYIPPERTGDRQKDKILIEKINLEHSMEKLDIILNETPTYINRELYDSKLEEMLQEEAQFLANKEEFKQRSAKKSESTGQAPQFDYGKHLVNIINNTDNFVALIAAGAEFWTLINGRPISKAGRAYDFNIDWLSENVIVAISKYPHKKNHWIKSYRTRIKNMCKTGSNYNGIKFFIDFLVEKYEDELESNDPGPMNPYVYINHKNIPF
jgi:superfamily II DNA or RNA helicase